MREALPDAPPATRTLAGDLVMSTLRAIGKDLSERDLSPRKRVVHVNALADMLCAYLAHLGAA